MGDIFCLIILESGSRRKLKLQTGTYNELLGSLAGIVEVDSNNTLVQIFDTDLDDFVDLLPGDIVPNKAKLRVIQKAASALCTPVQKAVSPPSQSTLHIVSTSSVAVSQPIEQKRLQPSILPSSGDRLQEGESADMVAADAEPIENEDEVMRLSQIPDMLRAMLPRCTTAESGGNFCAVDIMPAMEEDRNDYLKFNLPSFGLWCDIILRKKGPVTGRLRKHIINTIFEACFKITLYPTRRLYRRAIDSLVVKYPHLVSGSRDWERWCISLRAKFKYLRRKIPEQLLKLGEGKAREGSTQGRKEGRKRTLADLQQILAVKRRLLVDPDEPLNSNDTPESRSESVEPGNSEPASFQAESEQGDTEQEPNSCPDTSEAASPVDDDDDKNITVADLLGMCTDEAAAEKLVEKAANELSVGGKKRGRKASEKTWDNDEVPVSDVVKLKRVPKSVEHLKFKLPPFTGIQPALNAKQPLDGRLRSQIVNCLYAACRKITLYPSKHLYRTAVDSLLMKYPYLRGSDDETGRQIWLGRLRAKFKNVRRHLPEKVLTSCDYGGKRTSVITRRQAQKNINKADTEEAAQRNSRTVRADRKVQATKAKTSEQAVTETADETTEGSASEFSQLVASRGRHESVKDMPVEEAIMAFACYRKEPSLLAEFKILWKVDIAEAFEKGIKRLFLVLMNSGTSEEILTISEADGDILQVVLDAIAKRFREKISALITEETALPTTCLVKRANGSFEVFVDGYFLFTASSLLGGICSLFASFWVFHIEYPWNARKILTFVEHAFLNMNYTKPQVKTWELINLYRGSSPE